MTGFIIMTLVMLVLVIVFAIIGFDFLAIISGLIVLLMAIVCGVMAYDYKASEYKASIINREYNTNYTSEEIFYAKDVIETIQQIKRTRIDIQGLDSDD